VSDPSAEVWDVRLAELLTAGRASPGNTDTRPEVATATRKDAVAPAPHPPEFRRRAVELARERSKPVAELAKELHISESCLRNWMAQADIDESGSATELTSKEKKELA
jgi:hypothetical protein